jgi:hypothetical protein
MVPTGPREARPDDRLRTRPGISRFRARDFVAPRNDELGFIFNFQTAKEDATPHSRGTKCPGDASSLSLERTEGAGNAGRFARPQPRVRMEKAHELVTTGTPKHHDIPCATVLAAYTCSCVRKIWQNVRTGGSDQPPVAGSEPVRARRPREPDGEQGTDPVSSSTRTVAWASSPDRARKGAG